MPHSFRILWPLFLSTGGNVIRHDSQGISYVPLQTGDSWYVASVSFNSSSNSYLRGACSYGLQCLPQEFDPIDDLLFMEDYHFIESARLAVVREDDFPHPRFAEAPIFLGLGPRGQIANANTIQLKRASDADGGPAVALYLRPFDWNKGPEPHARFSILEWSEAWRFGAEWIGISGLGEVGSVKPVVSVDPANADIIVPISSFPKPSISYRIERERLFLKCSSFLKRNSRIHVIVKGDDTSLISLPIGMIKGDVIKSRGRIRDTHWCPSVIRFTNQTNVFVLGAPAIEAYDIELNQRRRYIGFIPLFEARPPTQSPIGSLPQVRIYSAPQFIRQDGSIKIHLPAATATASCGTFILKSSPHTLVHENTKLVMIPRDHDCGTREPSLDVWSGTHVDLPVSISDGNEGVRIVAKADGPYILILERGGPSKKHLVLEFKRSAAKGAKQVSSETIRAYKQTVESLGTLDSKISQYR